MKTISSKRVVQLFAGCALVVLGSQAFATSTWSNLGNGGATACTATAGSGVAMGNVLNCGTQNGVTLNADAFSTSNGANSSAGIAFATAALYNWGSHNGLGVVNKFENPNTTGPHATDNQYGTDAVRLSFTGGPVTLTSVGVGWVGSDSDLSVLAWTGSGTPGKVATTTLTGIAGGGTLLGSGWTLVGNYADMGSKTNKATGISSGIYSSYWLVSAYNGSFGSTVAGGTTGALGIGSKDYFKLLSVAGNTQPAGSQVPEPGSLALLGAGLFGLMASRRRHQKAAGA